MEDYSLPDQPEIDQGCHPLKKGVIWEPNKTDEQAMVLSHPLDR